VYAFDSNPTADVFRVMEAEGSSLVHAYQTTRTHKLEDHNN